MAIARAWATGGRGGAVDHDDPFADAIAAHLGSRAAPPDPIEIAPDVADVVALFMTLGTQWRRHPFAGMITGLDYAAIPATAAMAGIAITPAIFTDLRVMEDTVVRVVAERMTK